HKNKLLTSNPALKQTPQRDGITFHHEAEVSMFLSREQALSLKTQLSPEDWPLVGFALETGMRRHEQFSMKWSQVNFDTGFVTLPLLKSGKTTQIALSDYAIEILKSLDSFTRSAFVFPSPKNPLRHLNADAFCIKVFLLACRRAGIPTGRPDGITWHSLRHSCASWKAQSGIDLYSIGKQLGHKRAETTKRYS